MGNNVITVETEEHIFYVGIVDILTFLFLNIF